MKFTHPHILFDKIIQKPQPKINDKRSLTKFAFLPTQVIMITCDKFGNKTPEDCVVWLESYTIEEVFCCDSEGYCGWEETDRTVTVFNHTL